MWDTRMNKPEIVYRRSLSNELTVNVHAFLLNLADKNI